jgi:hypothetical protein
MKKLLLAFYQRHRPANVMYVDEFVLKYTGREREMVSMLKDKYGAAMSQLEILQLDSYVSSLRTTHTTSLRLSPRVAAINDSAVRLSAAATAVPSGKRQHSPPKVPKLRLGSLSSLQNNGPSPATTTAATAAVNMSKDKSSVSAAAGAGASASKNSSSTAAVQRQQSKKTVGQAKGAAGGCQCVVS